MKKNQIRSNSYLENGTQLLSATTFLVLAMLVLLGASNPVWANEQDRQAFQQESIVDFPKQAVATRFSYSPSQERKSICGIKKKFEITTFLSKPEGRLKSRQLINKFYSSNEYSVKRDIQMGEIEGALFEIRF